MFVRLLSLKQIPTFSVGERLGAPDVANKLHQHVWLLPKASLSLSLPYGEGGPLAVDEALPNVYIYTYGYAIVFSPHPSAYAATSTFCLQNSTRRLRHSPRWGRLLVSLFRTRSPHNAATILRTNHIKPVGTGVLDGPFRTCNFYLINGYDIIYSTDALCKLKGIATLDRRGRRSLQSMKIIAVWNIMPDVANKSHQHVRLCTFVKQTFCSSS